MKPGLLTFGFVSAQSQGLLKPAPSPKADDRHRSPKVKNPGSEWLQIFLKRSERNVYVRVALKRLNIRYIVDYQQLKA